MDEEVFESRGRDTRWVPPYEDGGLAQNPHARRSPVKPARYSVADPYPEFYAILGDDGLSASQKELAARLYSALKAIANWLVDLEAWIWIESFAREPLPADQPAAQGSAMAMPPEIDMWESLPSSAVDQYERQLDSIFEQLDRMALDELKEMVLDIHQGNSRPSSSYSTFTESKLAFLDDFSFFVTSVMLKIIPPHARLKQRLHTWSIRISVFHLVPTFLEHIRLLRLEMDRIWPELAREVSPNESLVVEQNRLELLKASAQARMSYTGRILDDMLDLLEGQSDVLPVKWIDGFESLENDLSSWTLASERRMFRLRSANGPVSPTPITADVTQSSSPIPNGPAASTLERPDPVKGPDLVPASSLVIPAPESYPKTPNHMNTLEHENTAPMDEVDSFHPIVSAKEEIKSQGLSHETSGVPEATSNHTSKMENQNPTANISQAEYLPAACGEETPSAAPGKDVESMSTTATKEGHRNAMSTTSRPEHTNPPPAGEHQNTSSAVSDDPASHTLQPATVPLQPGHGLRDPISTPSSQVDETIIQYNTESPGVRTPHVCCE